MTLAVLYVDDDRANLTVFKASFEDDFEVLLATSGAEALAQLEAREVGVLLTDQRMPEMTGVELAARARQGHPNTLRYLITAYSDLQEAIAAINHGQVQRYFRKPWNLDELRAALHEGLELYQLRARTRSLESRLVEIERIYSLGVVAAGIAHELRNPLTAVQGNLELLHAVLATDQRLASVESGSAHDTATLVDEALSGVHRIIEIVQGVELSTRHRETAAGCNPAEVVRLTLKLVRSHLASRAVVTFDDAEVPRVRGSDTRIGQVVLNLITNALEAFPAERDAHENRVTIRLEANDGNVELEVTDNGAGISSEDLPRIFDPFFTTKADGGTGLGLAISRKIVEEQGGSMEVTTEPGSGTRFLLRLPVFEEQPAVETVG